MSQEKFHKTFTMTLIDKAFALKRTSPFEAVDLELLLPFADILALAHYNDDDVIFEQDEEAHHMFFIVKGHVEVEGDHHHSFRKLGKGNYFGEEALFSGLPRAYSAYSRGETDVLILPRTHLFLMIEESPNLAVGFLRDYASRLQTPRHKEINL